MYKRTYYVVNGITFYRLLAAPFLGILILNQQWELFRWLLAISFLTDAVDGWLARHYEVASIFGAKLDSIADDLTTLVAFIGMIVFNPAFIKKELIIFIVLLALFVLQITAALIRYMKMTSFHTYLAKIATILQGIFLLLFFFLPHPVYWLFYLTIIITGMELIEEFIMVLVLPNWRTDVKGLYWALEKKRQGENMNNQD